MAYKVETKGKKAKTKREIQDKKIQDYFEFVTQFLLQITHYKASEEKDKVGRKERVSPDVLTLARKMGLIK